MELSTTNAQPRLTRRRMLTGGLTLGALSLLAACGATATPTVAPAASVAPSAAVSAVSTAPSAASSAPSVAPSGVPSAAPSVAASVATPAGSAAATPAAGNGYPREVQDAAGTVRIATAPARIATITNTYELDAVLALGVAPVFMGLRQGLGSFTGGDLVSWPWHEEALTKLGAKPERAVYPSAEPPVERIVAARPDLITQGITFQNPAATAQFKQAATYLALSADWRRNLRIVGQALDKLALAERLVAETDQKITKALDGLGLNKPTVTMAYPQNDGTMLVFTHPADARVDLFQRAGFVFSPELSAQASAEKPSVTVSTEQSKLLNADLIVVLAYQPAGTEAWLASPLAQGLTAIQKRRVLKIEQGAVAQGMAFFGPLNADAVLPTIRQAGELVKG